MILLLKKNLRERNLKTITLCAFGSASKGVQAQTIHHCFNLYHKSSNFEQLARKFSVTKSIKERFSNVSLIFIDEVYVLSPSFLQFINIALQKIFGNSKPFGNISVILSGDISQLPPVAQHSLWTQVMLDVFSHQGLLLYRSFSKVFWLNEAMRHKDITLRDLVYRIRTKAVTRSDVNLLRERCISNLNANVIHSFNDAVRIYPTNEELRIYNNAKLLELRKPTIWLKPVQTPPSPKMYEHHLEFPICIGAKVILTRNLDVDCWLTNNTEGIVEGFLFSPEDRETPAVIFVRFINTKNKTINGLTPISMLTETVKLEKFNEKIKISYFPLRLAYAISVHKSQGLTFNRLSIKLGKRDLFPAQAYVTISRAVSLKNLIIEDESISDDRFSHSSFFTGFNSLCEEYKRLGLFNICFKKLTDSDQPHNKKQKQNE